MTELLAGRYELGAQLGAGGMARVREAYDRTLARRVAVKLLHGETVAQPGMRERFLREARSAASFQHPNAVSIYDTGRDDGTPYIVMELVEGRSLAEVLSDRGALRQDEAVAVASQVLSALGAAHQRGLVHRDVKPANVLLPGGEVPRHPSGDPPAKLADFGIAKGLEEAAAGVTATGQVLGTPRYVSPEQVSGQPATPKSDVYSIGVMLYEMLAGRPPFEADSAIALALAHREDPVPRLDRRVPGIDPSLAAVVHRALEKDPQHRFTDANEMRAALAGQAIAPAAPPPATVPFAGDPYGSTAVVDEPRAKAPWGPVVLVAALALALLAIVAVDWDGLFDRFGPAPLDADGGGGEEAGDDPPADEDEQEDGGGGGNGNGQGEGEGGDGEGEGNGEGEGEGEGGGNGNGNGNDGNGEGEGEGQPDDDEEPPPEDEEEPPPEDEEEEEEPPPEDEDDGSGDGSDDSADEGDGSADGGDGSEDGEDTSTGQGQADEQDSSNRRGTDDSDSDSTRQGEQPPQEADPADGDQEGSSEPVRALTFSA